MPQKKRPDPKKFGHIDGVFVGKTFASRKECSDSGVHPGIQGGIYGDKDGARSVALSGGYEDDEDKGDSFTYTGSGGRGLEPDGSTVRNGPQKEDQTFENRYNHALLVSSEKKKPVRVIRGHKLDSIYAPPEGYRYDGLYIVEKAWRAEGKSGHKVCRFLFMRLPDQFPIPRHSYHLNLNRLSKSKREKKKAIAPVKIFAKDERKFPVPAPAPAPEPTEPRDSQPGPSRGPRHRPLSSSNAEAGPSRLPISQIVPQRPRLNPTTEISRREVEPPQFISSDPDPMASVNALFDSLPPSPPLRPTNLPPRPLYTLEALQPPRPSQPTPTQTGTFPKPPTTPSTSRRLQSMQPPSPLITNRPRTPPSQTQRWPQYSQMSQPTRDPRIRIPRSDPLEPESAGGAGDLLSGRRGSSGPGSSDDARA